MITMKKEIANYILLVSTLCLIISCNWTSKEQNLKGLYGKRFCLDVQQTESVNKIKIGNGTLTFKKDMSFEVINDSLQYSNIKGVWDICCYDSDYGNYIFKVGRMAEWKTSSPEFYIKVKDKEVRLIFKVCN